MGVRDVALRVRSNGSLMPAAVTALSVAAFLLAAQPAVMAQPMVLPGKFDVGGTGAAAYSIPISVPPGTAGMTPALTLSYSSQGGNGIVGVGWSLSGLASINRCGQTFAQDGVRGSVNFDSNDRFCMDGQRLVAISGAYGADGTEYRTEIDSFTRIISHGTAGNGPAWFEVHTKSGQIMQFGNTADSLLLAQGKTTARNWGVNKVSDTKGNYYTVTYTNDTANGQAYPVEIDYTGNTAAGLAPYNKVQFLYATRPDIIASYQAGSLARTTVRLTDVQTYAGTSLVADYKLAYQRSPSSQNSEVTSITLCAGDGSCLPASTVSWTAGGPGTFTQLQNTLSLDFGAGAGASGFAGDFNGDGKTDYWMGYFPGGVFQYNVLFSSNGDGTFNTTTVGGNVCRTPVDLNGDGKADCLVVPVGKPSTTGVVYASLGNGDGTFTTQSQTFTTGASSSSGTTAGDFNGDGKVDLLVTEFSSVVATTGNDYILFSNGDGTFSPGSTFAFPKVGSTTSTTTSVTGDFNGDGKTDPLFFAFTSGNTNSHTDFAVFLSNGDGSFKQSGIRLSGGPYTPLLGDFNGDGKTDFLVATGATQYVFLSKGDGTFVQQTNTLGTNFGFPITAAYFLAVGDFNGDGKTDYMLTQNTTQYMFLSNGDGTFTQQTNTIATGIGTPADGVYSVIVGDFNGDGKTDYVMAGHSTQYVFLANGGPVDLVQSITSGLGATTAITYQPMTQASVYTKDTNAVYPLQDVVAAMYLVSRVDTSNGIGGTASSTYSYAGAKADLNGRFLGFRQITATDLQTGIVATTNNRQDYPYIGLAASTTKTLGSVTLSSTTSTYQFSNASGAATMSTPSLTSAPYQVSAAQSVASSADLDGSGLPTVTTSYQYDTFGNATQVVVSASDGHSKTTTSTYTNDTVNWLLGRLTSASVTSVGPAPPPPPPPSAPTITLLPASLPNATGSYSQTVSASGGAAPYTYSISTGSLPGGLILNPSTGAITGMPAASGTSNFTITASDANNNRGSQAYSLTVCGTGAATVIVLTSGSSWTVPSNWCSLNNTIEVIGGGGGGGPGDPGTNGPGSGGGGGGYSKITNLNLMPGALIPFSVGAGGAGAPTGQSNVAQPGGDTWLNGASFGSSSVAAKGGAQGVYNSNGGQGGRALAGIASGAGSQKFSGGTGNQGGGGAAGPFGNGRNGASAQGNGTGGGGGGAGGGTDASINTGGNNHLGTGGGAFGNPGTAGGGGGGNNGAPGGAGGNGTEWTSAGSGGGGGGGGRADSANDSGGNGGLYGGGGGGGGNGGLSGFNDSGGNGAPGIIVLTYRP
jgi:hypothetical protein